MGIDEDGDRQSPASLPADAPVGTGFEHTFDAFLAPVGDPADVFDGFEGEVAEGFAEAGDFLIDADEPLLGCAEDDGSFASPAVGVAVGDFLLAYEGTILFRWSMISWSTLRTFLPRSHSGTVLS